ncbi:MAG: site-2 protease family protein [Actinobacteria bacterium]|jgi:Zn-dependent protease/CBS domain-containing protein|nr:site-2 protease family protein [Actinomycetota bacterium]PLS86403.1 MAG: site-2 protease family protein [Actinomycetota bacterium]
MGNSFKIGRFAGIDVKVHWTFFLLLAFFGYVGYTTAAAAGIDVTVGIVVTIAVILTLFLCVVLHEFGHSLVAQRLGIDVSDITLLPIGGVARLKTLPEKPVDEIKIAVAGPLVNVVLAPIFLGLALAFGVDLSSPPGLAAAQQSLGGALFYLGIVNIFLVVFNLIPAFPLDGGRVLRGLLAIRLGPVRATDISAAIGQALAIALGIIGFATGGLGLILIAIFVFFGASGEQQMVRQREMTRGLDVSDVMGTKRRTETVSPYNNFGQVLDAVIHGYQVDFPVVDDDGRVVGMLTRGEIFPAVHSPDKFRDVRDVMRTDFPMIAPDADLFTEGNRILQESGMRAIPVVQNGELVGMLTVDDIGQASLLRDLRKPQY